MSAANGKKKHAVLATLSSNRVGIVWEVTRFIEEHDSNLVASYAVRLGTLYGEFFQFEATPAAMKAIRAAYRRRLKEFKPRLYATKEKEVSQGDFAYLLTVYSFDRPGIVCRTAMLLKELDVDIRHIAGSQYPAQEIGVPLFVVEMKLDLPSDLSENALRTRLDALADENDWDFDFERASRDTRENDRKEHRRYPPSREQYVGNFRLVRGSSDERSSRDGSVEGKAAR